MCDQQDLSLKKRHSYCQPSHKQVYSGNYCRSDANLVLSDESINQELFFIKDGEITSSDNSGCGEYYKQYEHDAMPAKDDSISCDVTSESGKGEGVPLTESRLAKLEEKIYSNISQELPTSGSATSLDSNAQYFKTTVEKIFDKFYANMIDFEQYKMRYQEILSRNQNSVKEMDDFIKDMIHHILSSESADFNQSRLCTVAEKGTSVDTDSTHPLRNLHVVEAFKNDSYLTDSTEEKPCRSKPELRQTSRNEDSLSVYLMTGTPELKMNNRKLLSAMNFCETRVNSGSSALPASAEDLKKVAAKKLALELYERQNNTSRHCMDREIPVKLSFAKKNIHLDEDFDHTAQNEKSFISRICDYLCKRLRKTSIV